MSQVNLSGAKRDLREKQLQKARAKKTELQTIAHRPEVGSLTESESQRASAEWNDTARAYGQGQCIHELIEAHAEQTPDAVAVVFRDQNITYGELNRRANQLAHYLQELGVGPDVLVGICLERSIEALLGILATLKAGGAYVPLDPMYPESRLAFMMENAQTPVLLTQQPLAGGLSDCGAKTIYLDKDWAMIAQENEENLTDRVTTQNLAYVLYTSGSTGRPKGVMIGHDRVVALLRGFEQTAPAGERLAGTLISSLGFDVSVWECFSVLCFGGTLHILLAHTFAIAERYADYLINHQISSAYISPALLSDVVTHLERLCDQAALDRILVGVEPIKQGTLQRFRDLSKDLRIVNGYGPTEATVCATFFNFQSAVDPTRRTPIGTAVPGYDVYLLDPALQPVPVGVPGEIVIGGAGLGWGYLNRPGMTAEQFIPHPFSSEPGARVYRTGDMARYLAGGNIEFIGRGDHQVKVRGFRVELGGVETVLGQHPRVEKAVVIRRDDGADTQLVAYLVPKGDCDLTTSELRRFAAEKLPDYMLPSAFVTLEALPLTPNGKVDRRALPASAGSRPALENEFVAPRTAGEELLAGMWSQVLGIERVGVRDNFFELGGHSLLATQVLTRVRDTFQVELSLRALFETPTVAGLAERVEGNRQAERGLMTPPITPVEQEGELPLSYAQQRLWFLDQWEPGGAAYNLPVAYRLEGALDEAALEQSLDEIVHRHQALRTTFETVNGHPIQVIAPDLDVKLRVVELCELPETEREAEVRRMIDAEAQQPFNLREGPLLRATLLRLGEREHVLLLTMHHIVSDGWSMGIFVRELMAFYRRFSTGEGAPLPELPVQYKDFAVWQREWLRGEVLETQLGYWKQQLDKAPALLELATDRPRPAVQSFRGARQPLVLPTALTETLESLSRQEGVTLFMTLLAAFKTLLHRYTGQGDIVVGSPIANRNRAEIEGLIGFFVNSLAMRTDLSDDPSFRELLGRVREVTMDAYAHQDLPFERLVEELRPERDPGYNPIFQVMFVLQNAPLKDLDLAGVTLGELESDSGTVKFDLTLVMTETERGVEGKFGYNTDLFDAETIARMASHFQTLVEGIAADPERRLADLPLLKSTERRRLLDEWNETRVIYPHTECIHQLFEEQAARTPDAIAVTSGEKHCTYRELDRRANQLAHHLRGLGVGPDVLVGISVERSPEMVVGLLGILKAGGAYVPLDPAYPRERLAFMARDSQLAILLTQQGLRRNLPAGDARVICLDSDWNVIGQENAENPGPRATARNQVYVIYTSGTTGKPKGVQVEHRSLVNYANVACDEFGVETGDRVLQFASISFDAAAEEIFPCLARGATLVLRSDEMISSATTFVEHCRALGLTIVDLPTAYWHQVTAEISAQGLALPGGLRLVIIGGERAKPEHLEAWQRCVGQRVRLLNTYGPTEATIVVTSWQADSTPVRMQEVPIGRPVGNVRAYVLDRHLQPTPIGVAGELHLGGAGLARGYLKRPGLTGERFVPDPFPPSIPPIGGEERGGGRLYKTGDRARYLGDGNIEFLGRLDQQVKIRGFRIELGEIEARLHEHPEMKEALVVVGGDGDEGRLIAYVVPGRAAPSTSELRAFLKQTLPDHMLPSAFVELEELPLTRSGKIDHKALPAPGSARPSLAESYVEPRTELERILAGMWEDLLGRERIGARDNFFELGGDSLRAAIFINLLQKELGEVIYVVVLFDAPTVASLADYLAEHYAASAARLCRERFPRGEFSERSVESGTTAQVDGSKVETMRQVVASRYPPDERATAAKNPPAVFILSAPRSGTTLLRVMLAGHPGLFSPPELALLSFRDLGERSAAFAGRDEGWLEGLLRAVMEIKGCGLERAREIVEQHEREGASTREFYATLQEWIGERVLVDKTTTYAISAQTLERAETYFDDALYVHLVRRPAAMVQSYMNSKLDQVFGHGYPFSERERAELFWLVSNRNIVEFFERIPERRRCFLRFEDLVRDPAGAMRDLCRFLGLEFDPEMLQPYRDTGGKMTDGVHPESKMVGDPKFHAHREIKAEMAEKWSSMPPGDELSALTLELAESLGYEAPGRAGQLTGPRPVSREGALPLSFAQQRLWFLDQWEPDGVAYSVPMAMRMTGRLDVDALGQSLDEIARRHEVLRTTFVAVDGQPVPVVVPTMPVPLRVMDVGESRIKQIAVEDAGQPFDLSRGPLLRVTLLRLGEEEHVMLLNMHHIVSDAWSMGVFNQELAALYGAFSSGKRSPLPELPVQYADFAVWQREWLRGEVLETQLGYWKRQLGGGLPILEIPTDRPRPAIQTFRGACRWFMLPKTLSKGLAALGQEEGCTLFMTLLAGFKTLLSRYTGQEDVIVGTPIANRNRSEIEGLIGFFDNTLVLRNDLTGDPSFRELLGRVRETSRNTYAHQDVPFEMLVEELQPERNMSHTPLFQVMFTLQNVPLESPGLPGLVTSSLEMDWGTAKFDLGLFLQETEEGLRGAFEYNTDLFDGTTIERLEEHFRVLLEGVLANPDQHLLELPVLTETERRRLLVEWNDTGVEYSQGCIHEVFEAQVERVPDAVAVAFGDQSLTYEALNRRANQLAHHLRGLGVGPEMLVGVCVERSLEMVVGMLGIFKAGGAYVPLDPAYPEERLAFILKDSRLSALLTQERLADVLPEHKVKVVCLDTDWEAIGRGNETRPVSGVTADNLAYVIYTSGSTGIPKGVLVAHRGLPNVAEAEVQDFALGPDDRVLQFASLNFDASIFEILMAWGAGATMCPETRESLLPGPNLARLLREQGVTAVALTPSTLTALPVGEFSALRTVIVGGEICPASLVARWGEGRRFFNVYGPTEATTWATVAECGEDSQKPPIGRPVDNVQVYLLGTHLRPVPVGVSGELHIGGVGLARGYLNRPDMTAERFVPNPFGDEVGARLYKTGDLARYLPDGNIEFLGRTDHQVKVHGFRIELGEIETVLEQHPAVREAVILAREDAPGDKRLVAYIVAREEQTLDINDLRRFLAEKLPNYMLPSAFVPLEALPLTPNGKVDRRVLPAPAESSPSLKNEFVPPRTTGEELLAGIWGQVLGIERVGVYDNFFELGGHSLLATQVLARARDAFQMELSLRALFEEPTIAGLAARIEATHRAEKGLQSPPIVPVRREQALPLSFAQQRLWFFDQWEPENSVYNIPMVVRLKGPLDVDALVQSLNEIVRRHEALRTTYFAIDGQPVQVIAPLLTLPLPVEDLRAEPERETQMRRLVVEEAHRPFDLVEGPLLRAALLRLAKEEHVLQLTMHHIVSDAWSVNTFNQELAVLYRAYSAGEPSPLPELVIQYADFAVWQREWLQGEVLETQLAYWKQQLGGRLPVLELLTDRPRPAVQTFRGAWQRFVVPKSVFDALRVLSRQEECTLFMTLLAAFKALLHRYTGQDDIIVGTPIANRNRVEIEGLIGFFVNTLVLRTDLSDNPTFLELLNRVREVSMDGYIHQDLPFEKLVEELAPERNLSHNPIFQVMFNYHNTPSALELPGLAVEHLGMDGVTAKFDLNWAVGKDGDEIRGTVTYNVDLFDDDAIRRMIDHFQTLLAGIVAEPGQSLAQLPLLTPSERQQLSEWSDTQATYAHVPCMHRLFEEQVARTPGAIAVIFEGQQYTYHELNRRANQVAHYLQSLGVGPDVRVGLFMERSLDILVALLGILKAGGAYVPLDPIYPQERVRFMLEDVRVSALVTQSDLAANLPDLDNVHTVCLDDDWDTIARHSAENPPIAVIPSNLIYVLFTSGSTGQPKGVAVEHRNYLNYFQGVVPRLRIEPGMHFALASTFSTDLGTIQFWAPLTTGGTVHIISYERATDPQAMADYFSHHPIDALKLVPSHFDALQSVTGCESILPRKLIIFTGEASSWETVAQVKAIRPNCMVQDHYGVTETTCATLTYIVPDEIPRQHPPTLPLGEPLGNVRVHILDPLMQPVPIGVPGELYIGGAGVTRGYFNRPALTARCFIPDPFSQTPGGRLYRTGDLAHYRSDGTLKLLGRADHQVKIRGYRIETGEIETLLSQHPSVRDAVIVAHDDPQGDPSEGLGTGRRLVAYVAPQPGQDGDFSTSALRGHLGEQLPDYMVPAIFVTLDAIPLNPNGKVDRFALPAPDLSQVEREVAFVAPSTIYEEILAEVWQEVLGLDEIGVHDDFFALGGHSLLATQVVSRVRDRFEIELPVRSLFEAPTIAEMATRVEQVLLEKIMALNEEEISHLLDT